MGKMFRVAERRACRMVGIALPLLIVTMAAQYIPGIALLNANGCKPVPGPLFATTGMFSLASAPFGR